MRTFMLVYFAPSLKEHHFTVGPQKPRLPQGCTEDFTVEATWNGVGDSTASLKEKAKVEAAKHGITIVGIS